MISTLEYNDNSPVMVSMLIIFLFHLTQNIRFLYYIFCILNLTNARCKMTIDISDELN